MQILAGIFAVMVAAAGWHYLFHSTAAQKLSGIEDPDINRKRVRLRRANGVVMLILAGVFFAMVWWIDLAGPGELLLELLLVMVLLAIVVVLTLIDLRLTWKLRRPRR